MKHAFLILAYNNYRQLDKLIKLLDHDKTDIFIHIDKKSPDYEAPITVFSKVYMLPRIRTNWGSFSLVECELRLLEKALSTNEYAYFHLLSGQDLPLKPISEILDFFESHCDYNFVHYDKPEASIARNVRVKFYYPFLNIMPRGRRSIWSIIKRVSVEIQKLLKIDRTKNYSGVFKAGSQWWSIKNDLAKFIVSNKKMIYKHFRHTMSDEMFVQTLVYNSKFYDTLYIKEEDDQHANLRLIDFKRGHPYVWTFNDFEELRQSDLFFARKFDENYDEEIIEKIVSICLL